MLDLPGITPDAKRAIIGVIPSLLRLIHDTTVVGDS